MSTAKQAQRASSGHSLRRDLGPIGLLFASVGSIIGSGWLFGALDAAQQAGPAAILSWIFGMIMILLIALVYAELGSMFPIAGGVVRFPHLAFGSFASYTAGWITWVAAATTAPIEVEAALQYATKYAPFTKEHMIGGEIVHTLTSLGYVSAVILMAVFVAINYVGIKWFASVNNVLVWWKLGVITLVVIAFLFASFNTENFSTYGFSPQGWHGVFTAIATSGIVFSFLGFRQAIELAGEGSNPKRNIPIAVVGSIVITGIIYVGLQVAFLGAVRPEDLTSSNGWSKLAFEGDFGPLAAIASLIGLGWLAVLLYIDAVVSPGDTGLIYTTTTARLSYAMGRNGNAPAALSKTTDRGVPFVSLLVAFVVGLIVFLPFPSWQQLVGFITSATVLSFGSGPLVLGALRRRLPDAERSFRLPGGDVVPILAFWAANLIVYWTGWDINWKLFVSILIGFVLLAVHEVAADTPKLEWRAGATWVLPWLGGLALISYLGDYGKGLGVIGFGVAFPVTLVLTLVIYYLAMYVALPAETIARHIEDAEADSEEEPAATA